MTPLEVLHTGQGYVAVRKPAGIATERHYDHDTVEARAQVQWQRPNSNKPPYVGLVHRLDRPVSGVLLLARNKSTLRLLNAAFAERRVQKTYLALTARPLPAAAGELRHLLTRDATRRRAVVAEGPGKDVSAAHLRYQLLTDGSDAVAPETGKTYRYAVTPVTGRFHQIRCQLAAAGAPLIGDTAYGSDQPYHPQQIALHAHTLAFADPYSGEDIVISCPPPF